MLIHQFDTYYADRVSDITEHFMTASTDGNEHAIHEMRVGIKKVRAFSDLVKGLDPKYNLKKAFALIRKLFKSAAGIRDAQVIQTLTREDISNAGLNVNISEYFNLLKQKELLSKKDFFRFCKTYDMAVFSRNRNLINKRLSKIGETEIEENSRKYLKNLLDIVNDLKLKSSLEENDFHDIRILCKKARYTLEILCVCYSQQDFDILNESLRGVHQALGQWHDTDVAISFLNNVLSDQSLKPLFSESSYTDVLKSLEERKQRFSDLFYERFNAIPERFFENHLNPYIQEASVCSSIQEISI
jgi:CHAD domain-containing protein